MSWSWNITRYNPDDECDWECIGNVEPNWAAVQEFLKGQEPGQFYIWTPALQAVGRIQTGR